MNEKSRTLGFGHLVLASLIWAFSFGLIKGVLTGYSPRVVAFVRLGLAALVFTPWLGRVVGGSRRLRFAGLGALQFGLMYMLYIASFKTLPAYAVALFTVFTPFYVVLLDDLWSRRFSAAHMAAALLAIAGSGWVAWVDLPSGGAWTGIALLQGANLCFAAGQLVYRRWVVPGAREEADERGTMAWMYLGAALVTGAAAGLVDGFSEVASMDTKALGALLYLGVVPTGVAFFLWNRGAARVGAGVLAAANNLKIPLAVIVAWTVFGEDAAVAPALGGLVTVLAAVLLASFGHRGKAQ